MERRDFRIEIDEAAASLNLTLEDFKPVNLFKYEKILVTILDKFTTLGKRGLSNAWLWEYFKEPQLSFYNENALNLLLEIISPLIESEETLWFIVEDERGTKKNGNFWLYEGKLKSIIGLLNQLTAFEYCVVPRQLDWLLCETHHNVLIGVGKPVVERLQAIKLKEETTASN